MVAFVIAITEITRSAKCKIDNFLKNFVKNRKLGCTSCFCLHLEQNWTKNIYLHLIKFLIKGIS